MDVALEVVIFFIACLLLLSVVTSKIALRFGIPSLVLFLFIGMIIGSEGIGGIEYDVPELTQTVGIVALVFILFSGGLDTQWEDVQVALKPGLLLSTMGVLLTAVTIGVFVQFAFGFTLAQGILLGATMASTDAAAVFSVLGGKTTRLSGSLTPILELESGSNDPMAIFLTLAMIELITNPQQEPVGLLILFFTQMSIGALVGIGSSYLMRNFINRIRLEYDGLYPVLSIAFVLNTYGLTTILSGNGFLAIYLAGLFLGRYDFIHKNSLSNFHDALGWLMQITMFLVLGLQVFPSRVLEVAPEGLLIAGVLIIVARPISVFVVGIFTGLNRNEKLFLSWVGLRGASPIILATFTQLSDVSLPLPIFELVFFVVIVSVILQGTTIIRLARRLDLLVSEPTDVPAAHQRMQIGSSHIDDYLLQLTVVHDADAAGKQIIDLGLPTDTLVVAINRASQIIIPRGGTIIRPDDEILILTDQQHQQSMTELFTVPVYSEDSTSI